MPRIRHLVAAGLVVWVAVATLVPLGSTLPPALRAGTAVRRLHSEITALGSGWTGNIEHASESKHTPGPRAWEWSLGERSTIQVDQHWSVITLDLSPVSCRGGERQRIALAGPGATTGPILVLTRGFHQYSIDLGWLHGARELTLSYGCVVVPASSQKDGDPRPLAVAIAGLDVQRFS
jgi:hypothetical protein